MKPPESRSGAVVRAFEGRDVGPACLLTNLYIRSSAAHFGIREGAEEEFRAIWEAGRGAYPWVAAEVEGRFAGYAKAGVWRTREAYSKTAETGLYVEPDFQGRGVGRALYEELLKRVKVAGYHTIVAGITLPNEASVRLHEGMGFRKVGVFREVGRKFDHWHDVGWWQVML